MKTTLCCALALFITSAYSAPHMWIMPGAKNLRETEMYYHATLEQIQQNGLDGLGAMIEHMFEQRGPEVKGKFIVQKSISYDPDIDTLVHIYLPTPLFLQLFDSQLNQETDDTVPSLGEIVTVATIETTCLHPVDRAMVDSGMRLEFRFLLNEDDLETLSTFYIDTQVCDVVAPHVR